jgi:hypothetical protein
MKTDELAALLATGAGPVERHAAARRFAAALACGLPAALLAMLATLGMRPDMDEASRLPMFWLKIVFSGGMALAALHAATRLSRPGMHPARMSGVLLAVLLAALWGLGAMKLFGAPPAERAQMIFGVSWRTCPFNIALLSLPVLAAAMWSMRELAPTRLALAGGAAGLLAGSVSAAVYALHCPEMEAPFIAIWYVLGIAIPTAAGALAGPRVLRW